MDSDAADPKPDVATFLGIDYIGDIDEFQIYDRRYLDRTDREDPRHGDGRRVISVYPQHGCRDSRNKHESPRK